MGKDTKIEWAHHTFNPWWGCTKVSPACDHCYAETFARRVGFNETGKLFPIWGAGTRRRTMSDQHWREPLNWDLAAARAGERHRVFCGSMCDVMEEHPDLAPMRKRLYELIASTVHLDWLLLTKRPQNFRRFLFGDWLLTPRRNVWGMTTVESQAQDWRIKALLETRLTVYGLSCEPLLGPIELPTKFLELGRRAWVIAGGESGPGARPMHPEWPRRLRDQCLEAGVPFHFKQHGEWLSLTDWDPFVHGGCQGFPHEFAWRAGQRTEEELPISCYRFGKAAAGRRLDDRTWDEFPGVAHG